MSRLDIDKEPWWPWIRRNLLYFDYCGGDPFIIIWCGFFVIVIDRAVEPWWQGVGFDWMWNVD